MKQADVYWSTCDHTGCIGIRALDGQRCLAHCSDDERAAALKVISETGEIDARGVTFSSMLLEQVLDATPHNNHGHSVIKSCGFDQATFDGASFRDLKFCLVRGCDVQR